MLKLQRQGFNECFPTTVAMLLDVPKDRIITMAQEILNTTSSWTDLEPFQMNIAYTRILREFNAPAFMRQLSPVITVNRRGHGLRPINRVDFEQSFISVGALQLVCLAFMEAHILAFDNGRYFDPATGILTPEELKNRWGGLGFIPIGITCDPDSFPMLCS